MTFLPPVNLDDNDVIDCTAYPFVYEGSSVHSHQKSDAVRWSVLQHQIELLQLDAQGFGDGVSGHVISKELEGKKVLNANVCWFLIGNIERIPTEWQDKQICFWGSIFLSGRAGLNIHTLQYKERGWEVIVKYLDEYFNVSNYTVVQIE